MPYDWEQGDEITAAISNCPAPDCGSLVIEYRQAGNTKVGLEPWEFTCSRCGREFAVAQDDLLFQSVPKQWLSRNSYIV